MKRLEQDSLLRRTPCRRLVLGFSAGLAGTGTCLYSPAPPRPARGPMVRPGIAAAGVWSRRSFSWPSRPDVGPVSVARSRASGASARAAKGGSIQIINDEQLLALFSGRPLARGPTRPSAAPSLLDQPPAAPEADEYSGRQD